ncbi:MAG: four-carbon acid sugar kinase family protein [Proteobacteria bacterium]|nr:four-carbon acid sugar kinase family protein [Pseudomonadota bacterium]
MLLGCIADDLTGATDLAIMLTRAGMRTLQVMEVPDRSGDGLAGYDAIVVALKTRTCPVTEAIDLSLRSAEALLALGARQLFFKYCSTFDSTAKGNIGPVAEALMARLKADLALVCPAFPTNKRTVYMGNLFVGDVPLAESPMKDHPLTPMRDSSLVRVMQSQSKGKVGLVAYPVVEKGRAAIAEAFTAAQKRGERFVVVDAITDKDLIEMGAAAADMPLITGGSGVALGLPANFIAKGLMKAVDAPKTMTAPKGRPAILAGSCSEATRGQVAKAKAAGIPAFEIDPLQLASGSQSETTILDWIGKQSQDRPFLVYSSAEPASVKAVQEKLGRDEAGHLVERTLAAVARELVANGVTRLIVAGGETSGAVVNGLGVTALEIGPEIDPGVPWTRAKGRDLVLALKSGNFGAPDFFVKAWERLA